jgi:DNA topoisomerase-1
MDSIQLADAFELFKLPRTLGTTATGETVLTAIGRFGPYVKYGAKYVSLKEDDPYTITLERALEVIQAKAIADANRIIQNFTDAKIQVLNGRYGPYITDGAKNARVPKDRDPKTLTLEECQALLAAAPAKNARGRFGRRAPAKAAAAAAGEQTGSPAGAAGAPAAAPGAAASAVTGKAGAVMATRKTRAPTSAPAAARTRRAKPAVARKKAALKKTSGRRR